MLAKYSRYDYADYKVVLIKEVESPIPCKSLTNCIENVFEIENLSELKDWKVIQKNLYGEYDLVCVVNGRPEWKYVYSESLEKNRLSDLQVIKKMLEIL